MDAPTPTHLVTWLRFCEAYPAHLAPCPSFVDLLVIKIQEETAASCRQTTNFAANTPSYAITEAFGRTAEMDKTRRSARPHKIASTLVLGAVIKLSRYAWLLTAARTYDRWLSLSVED